MIISLSTENYHPDAPLLLTPQPGTDMETLPVRMARIPTLDGGAVIDHRGLCQGDRTLTIKAALTRTEYARFYRMIASETLFTLSCEQGFFTGAIQSISGTGGYVSISFLVLEKIEPSSMTPPPEILPLPEVPLIATKDGWAMPQDGDNLWQHTTNDASTAFWFGMSTGDAEIRLVLFWSDLQADFRAASSVTVQITADYTSDNNTANFDIYAVESSNVAFPVSYDAVLSLSLSAPVAWAAGQWTEGNVYETPNIKSICPDITDWQPGSNFAIIIRGNRCATGVLRDGKNVNSGSGTAPRLVLS